LAGNTGNYSSNQKKDGSSKCEHQRQGLKRVRWATGRKKKFTNRLRISHEKGLYKDILGGIILWATILKKLPNVRERKKRGKGRRELNKKKKGEGGVKKPSSRRRGNTLRTKKPGEKKKKLQKEI